MHEKKEGKRISLKQMKTAYILLIVITFLISLIGLSAVLAKYLNKEQSEGSVRAKEFYFTGPFLDGEKHTLAPGSTEVTFTIGNHADDLRYAEVDIEYTVSVTPAATVSPATGSLAAGQISNQSVTVSGLTPGVEYTITAEGKGGYHKTLVAKVVVPTGEQKLYKYLDASNKEYVLLTVWSQGYQGPVTVQFPNVGDKRVLPDNTDEIIRSVKTIDGRFTDSITFNSDGYSSHTYRFFGNGVSEADFTVIYGTDDLEAEVKMPN